MLLVNVLTRQRESRNYCDYTLRAGYFGDYRTYSTALQRPCSSQTDYHFTATTDESKGQRRTEPQTGSSLQDQMLRLPGHLYR